MKTLSVFLVMSCLLTGGFAYGYGCSNDYRQIKENIDGRPNYGQSLYDQAAQNLNYVSDVEQSAQRMYQAASYGLCADVTSRVSPTLSSLQSKTQGARNALSNAQSIIRNEFEPEFQRAMAIVCEGHCSPGITDSLNKLKAIVQNSMNNVVSANQQLDGIDADARTALSQLTSPSQSPILRDIQNLQNTALRAKQNAAALLGDGPGSSVSLRNVGRDMDRFWQNGCVVNN